jgi:disulfide oxidoreductase YuzD
MAKSAVECVQIYILKKDLQNSLNKNEFTDKLIEKYFDKNYYIPLSSINDQKVKNGNMEEKVK